MTMPIDRSLVADLPLFAGLDAAAIYDSVVLAIAEDLPGGVLAHWRERADPLAR